jgi:hypothetical protein
MKNEYDFPKAAQSKFHVPIIDDNMLKSYEATLDNGQTKWPGEPLTIETAHIISLRFSKNPPQ